MRANQRLDDHEDRCRERYSSIIATLKDMRDDAREGFSRTQTRMWWAAGLMMTGMGALLMAFATHFLEIPK